MRSTAGTQGVVRAAHCNELYVGSLCVATATANHIAASSPEAVTFVNTGVKTKGGGEEDRACSEYMAGLIQNEPVDLDTIESEVRQSSAAARFTGSGTSELPAADLEQVVRFDLFDFVMKVQHRRGQLVLSLLDRG